MEPRLITAAERASRRDANTMPTPAIASPRTVLWRKKGCKSCQPIVVPTRVTITPDAP